MTKIDIHSHILPGVDDGSQSMEQTMEMLQLAEADGISKIIATPHFHYRRGHASPERILRKVREVNEAAKAAKIRIEVYPGNELYFTHELLATVQAGEALTLAGSDYVLLEFSPETEERRIQNAVYQFLSEGYYPILAHVERYQALKKNTGFMDSLLDMGAYFQVNAGSIAGDAGWNTGRFTKDLIKKGMVTFVATDAHDEKKRCPAFGKAADWLEKKYGAKEYLWDHPQMILNNMAI